MKYYLLGEKLSYSFSAKLHRRFGLDYELKEVKREAISRLLRERTPIYEKTCDIKIKNDGSVEETVENVLSAVKTRLKK